jgi:GTP-binding protein HflX
MPKQLLRAFHSTLKEAIYSDILMLVFDIARDNFEQQIASVENILQDLKVSSSERIYIFNKVDKVTDELKIVTYLKKYADKDPIVLSAIENDCKDKLLSILTSITDKMLKSYKIDVDIKDGKIISFIHNFMDVVEQKINTDKITYTIRAHPGIIHQLMRNYNVEVETM